MKNEKPRELARKKRSRKQRQENQMLVILFQASQFHLDAAEAEREGNQYVIQGFQDQLKRPLNVTQEYNEEARFYELYEYFQGRFDFRNHEIDYTNPKIGYN